MQALYFKCMMMMNLALPSLITLSLNACIYAELRDACVGLGIVALGVRGVKPAGEGVFG
jgi:hypothetical protein